MTSLDDEAFEVFDRNTDTNTLTQKAGAAGCFTFDGARRRLHRHARA